MKKLALTILSLIIVFSGFSQLENPFIRRGNRYYQKQKYPQAETQYRMALKKNPNSFIAKNNLGLSLYRENNDTTAVSVLAPLLLQTNQKSYMSQAAYNLGDVFTKVAGDSLRLHNVGAAIRNLEKAQKVLQHSVMLNPDDYQARYNLWEVHKVLDSLKKQSSKGGHNQQKKQNNKQNQNKNQQKKQNNQQKKQNQNQNQNQQKQNQQQNQQKQFKGLSPQEIERMLKAVEQQDKRIQPKALRRLMNLHTHKKTDKNW